MYKTEEKNEIIDMFSDISEKYDLLNNLMTFGMHHIWKKEAVKLALRHVDNPRNILDFCSGTGDLTVFVKKRYPEAFIVSSDLSKEMQVIADNKFKKSHLKNIEIKNENAEELNYPSGFFDLAMVGFGLRNVKNKKKCLQQVVSCLKPNGVFMCIDLGHPENKIWNKIYSYLFNRVIPFLGKIFAKNKEAYTYLPESLSTWYKQEELKEILLNIGFKKCEIKNFLGGIVAVHIAYRLKT